MVGLQFNSQFFLTVCTSSAFIDVLPSEQMHVYGVFFVCLYVLDLPVYKNNTLHLSLGVCTLNYSADHYPQHSLEVSLCLWIVLLKDGIDACVGANAF